MASASPPNMEKLRKSLRFLKNNGLKVKLGKNIRNTYGYLAGTDIERLEDFHCMIADPTIKAIFFAKGGYGTGRLASCIDYELISKNPKIIWGYSDITYLHTAIRQSTNLVTFHGPMLESDVARDDFDHLSKDMFNQLFKRTTLRYSEKIAALNVLVEGKASGKLVGGNLSLLTSTLGTPYEIDVKGNILLIEDVNEEPYRVDSMLNQLKYANKLTKANGIIVGDFANTEPKRSPSLQMEEVFQHYFSSLTCPVMTGFKIGHCLPHFAVPLGAQTTMNTENKLVTIEPGVI
ncbi:LD-carboxypeptidase [Pseudogracilibacillus auburnensis]|nr:LD-carboxypeptidase [Pseudogracilibacillus auburnensis]